MSARIDDEKAFLPNKQEMPQAFTTDEERDREAKAAINKEKAAVKLADAASKKSAIIEAEIIKANAGMKGQVLDAMLQAALGGPEAGGAEGAPAPGGPAGPPPIPMLPPDPSIPAGPQMGVNGAA
jgi:hypothetical protein